MKKLKKEVFIIIYALLTIFLISILGIFNYQDYTREYHEVESNLNKMETGQDRVPMEKNQETPPAVFMDTELYTVKFDSNYNITSIVNNSNNNVTDEEIGKIAKEIINTSKTKNGVTIQNLYFSKYSYSFGPNNTLTIIDNSNTAYKLKSLLKNSIIIFIILEIIIIIVSNEITKWITKPAEESFAKQKQFIADASHELKTPIAVIMANAEILEKEPEEKKWLNNIKSESERMNELVTDLLDLAKLENGPIKETYIEENLSKIVEEAALTFEGPMYENKIKFNYDIEENIKLKCNRTQIKQLIAILLDNAIKHSENEKQITLTLKKEKNIIILNVKNRGKEIPKEEQEKIFERFYRGDESRNRNTNRYGLGLAIAKNIVINHNGKISVESKDGVTTFIVKIFSK